MGWREEVRAQLSLALPVVTVQLGLIAMGAVDSAFMGRVSARDFAGVTLGHLWTFLFLAFGMGLLTALDPVISQAYGARDERAITRGLQRGVLLALVGSVPLGAGVLLAEPFFTLFGQPEKVIPIATRYSWISIAGMPAFLLFFALRQSLQALHVLRPLIFAILVANLLNLFFDWVLIFGNLGCPPLGAEGSAWATVGSRWAMFFVALWFAWPLTKRYFQHVAERVFSLAPMLRMIRIGVPTAIQFTAEFSAFSIIALFMGWLGERELAGHQVALQLASISFMVPLGISMAATVRVGYAVGRGDAAGVRVASAVGLASGAGVMLLFAVLFFTTPAPLAGLLSDLPEVVGVAVLLIPLAGVFQVFDGTQVVAVGILRGTADTLVPMVIHFVGFWGVGVPIGYYLAFERGRGPEGLWWGLVAGLAAVALVQILRVRNRVAQAVERVVIE